jgi:hypothetical protein
MTVRVRQGLFDPLNWDQGLAVLESPRLTW